MAARLVFVVALVLALLALWQATTLPMWDIFGPGPGLFPVAVTLFCSAVAAALAVFPRLAGGTSASGPDPVLDPSERVVFVAYALALPALAVGALWLGFIVTSIAIVLALTWLAERRGIVPALMLGTAIGVTGVVVFYRLLDAEVPIGVVDDFLLRLVR